MDVDRARLPVLAVRRLALHRAFVGAELITSESTRECLARAADPRPVAQHARSSIKRERPHPALLARAPTYLRVSARRFRLFLKREARQHVTSVDGAGFAM